MLRFFKFRPALLGLLMPCLAHPAGAQVLTTNGGSVTIRTGGGMYVKGGLTNAASSTITNYGTLNVSGNTQNNGTLSAPAASTLILDGSTAQTLGGSSAVNAKDVIVNNPAGVILSTPLNVEGVMSFSNGVINAPNAAAPLTFGAAATIGTAPSDASHVNGYVRKSGTGAFQFPVGDGTKYQPVGVSLSANSAGMTARYYAGDAGTAAFGTNGSSPVALLYYNKREYWDLVPGGTATGTVTVYYDAYNNAGITNTADLRVAHKSGGQWLNEGGVVSGTVAAGSLTSNSISSFSPFTLGSVSSASALPVRLIAFGGRTEGRVNNLEWTTGVESPGIVFELERSPDAVEFKAIAKLAGTGASGSYRYADDQAGDGMSYYRLSIAEADGARTFSNIVVLRGTGAGGAVSVYPLPARDRIVVDNRDASLNGRTAEIFNVAGQVVVRFRLSATQALATGNWPSGMYQLRLPDGTAIRLSKL